MVAKRFGEGFIMAIFNGTSGNNTLTGAATNDYLYGYAGNDSLIGGNGNDVLDGGSGIDTMVGGFGNDSYYIDNVSDVVIENAGEGTDTVYLSASTYNFTTIFIEKIYLVTSGSNISVTANSLANYIKANALANLINALQGNDTIYAGDGNDTINGGDDNDVIFGENGNDSLDGGTGNDRLYGAVGSDTLIGGDGNDTLSGGINADSMTGGMGNDTYYVDEVGDVVVEALNEGTDIVYSEVSYTLTTNVENLILASTTNINGTGNALNNNLRGNSGNNSLTGGDGGDTLNGGEGNDTLVGGTGNDRYYVDSIGDVVTENPNEGTDVVYSSVTYTLGNNLENLVLLGEEAINGTGNNLNNRITGNNANNSLVGSTGNDTLIGGGGNDTLVGGEGDDVYYVDAEDDPITLAIEGDVVTENANGGKDTVYAAVSYIAPSNIEQVYLSGTSDINVTGNTLNNTLRGNTANNILDGSTGDDIMYGGAGDDTYYVDVTGDKTFELASEGNDTVVTALTGYTLQANVESLISTRTSAVTATGNASNNTMTGTAFGDSLMGDAGNDTLIGGGGNDTLVGGEGDDTYYVDSASDVITEAVDQGTDTVYTTVTYTLAAEVENLILVAGSSINGTGNGLANTITGNDWSNSISGGTGADTLIGLDGDDIYVVDNAADIVTEADGQGLDTVESSVNWTLGANFENLTLTLAANVNATGNELSNTIQGNIGNNLISALDDNDFVYGNAGADTIDGGNGNDLVYGDDLANTANGADSVSGGAGDDSLYGGQGNDIINGGADNDLLDGGTGNDTMNGGTGNDTYYMNVATDVVNENLAEGNDTVIATTTFNYTLTANFENLTMLAGGTATGNASDNIISANNGVANTLTGGTGNDIYYVDNLDTIAADAAGTDSVFSSATHTLIASIENLTLIGTAAIDGTGNATNNVITGNASANRLRGGTSTVAGGNGTDTLQGGLGDDVFVFTNAASMQNVTITEAVGAGNDYVELSTAGLVITTNYNSGTNVTTITVGGSTPTGFSATGVEGVRLAGGGNAMTATGGSGADRIISGGNNKVMNGGDGNDYLDSEFGGGTGSSNNNTVRDTLNGGNGSDTYVISTWDYYTTGFVGGTETGPTIQDIVNDTGTGSGDIDTVIIQWSDHQGDTSTFDDEVIDAVSVTIGAGSLVGVENLIFRGTSDQKNATGNGVANMIIGGAGANNLSGLAGNDSLYGGFGNDTLNGGADNDLIDGGDDADNMTGGNGNDTYYVDNAGDVVNFDSGGTDIVYSAVTFSIAGLDIETLTLTGGLAANATGSTGNDLLRGNDGNNIINGNGGVDTMEGGAGDDTYTVDSTTDVVTELLGAGTDTVNSSVSFDASTIAGRLNIENITLTGIGLTVATGNDLDNTLTGRNTVANTLIGGLGDDIYIIDQFDVISGETGGSDTVRLAATVNGFGTYTLAAALENLVLQGTQTGLNGTGNASDNGLWGSSNTAANVLTGLGGNDYYVLGTGDTAVEAASAGYDTAYIDNINYSASLNNIEQVIAYNFNANGRNINLATTTTALYIVGSTFNDSITGGSANDTLLGGGGNDTLNGGGGNDSYYIDGGETITDTSGTDTVYSAITYTIANTIENLTLTGSSNINATGNIADNILTGNEGINVLTGGNGSDTYIVNNAADTVVETLASFDDFTSGLPIANYTRIGGASPGAETVDKAFDNSTATKYLNSGGATTGVGVDFGSSVIVTSLGLTTANDAAHRDPKTYTLYGSNTSVNDTATVLSTGTLPTIAARLTDYPAVNFVNATAYRYYRLIFNTIVGGGGDTNLQISEIRLSGNTGTDTIQSSVDYTLSTNVENLTLTGNAINGTGNTANNVLTGNTGNNILDGSTGTDTMLGGLGDDTYYVDVAGDVVTELASQGLDTVVSTVSYTLGANVENLIGGAAAGLTLTGNASDNVLTSQGAATTMVGGLGNDLFVIDGTDDIITEVANQGRDTIQSTVNYTISANVEDIILVEGSAATTATGNALDNTLVGNNNTNTLIGGAGDDTYFVDATLDVVTENLNEGIDTVNASATYTLLANVENLIVIGAGTINATGNSLDNIITGGTGDNIITGNGGNDTLSGGQGTDTLNAGLTGNNVYNFIRDDAIDNIVDGGGNDILNFASLDISFTQLWFKHTGNDLQIDIIGTNDSVYVKDWYLSANNRVETINSGDGYTLTSSNVQVLVQAMSTLTQPSLGETGLAPENYDALELTFYATWQAN
jgi:Ca2+-binding RTX toxin-like protein